MKVGISLHFALADMARELGAGVDSELGVDPGELRLDRLRRHEQRRGRLLVRAALGDELGQAALGHGETAAGRRAAGDSRDLRPRPLGPERRTEGLEARECLLKRLARGAPLLGAALDFAEREQRPGALERGRARLLKMECLLERGNALFERSGGSQDKTAAARKYRRGARSLDGKPMPVEVGEQGMRARATSPSETSASKRSPQNGYVTEYGPLSPSSGRPARWCNASSYRPLETARKPSTIRGRAARSSL